MDELVQQLANGVTKGSYYALIALGYTMVYGIIQLINFAHGEVFMLGAFIGLWTFNLGVTAFGWGGTSLVALVVVLLMATLLTPLIGVSLERFAYRPLRNAPAIRAADHRPRGQLRPPAAGGRVLLAGQLAFPDLFPNTSFQIFGASIQLLGCSWSPWRADLHPDRLHPHHPARQGDARRRGPGHGPADGHQRRPDHRPDLHHRLGPCRHRRGPGRHVPRSGQLLHGPSPGSRRSRPPCSVASATSPAPSSGPSCSASSRPSGPPTWAGSGRTCSPSGC